MHNHTNKSRIRHRLHRRFWLLSHSSLDTNWSPPLCQSYSSQFTSLFILIIRRVFGRTGQDPHIQLIWLLESTIDLMTVERSVSAQIWLFPVYSTETNNKTKNSRRFEKKQTINLISSGAIWESQVMTGHDTGTLHAVQERKQPY